MSGENQVAVRVVDPGAKPDDLVEGINYAEIPHGKQNWYVQTSGLWQSVELDYRPRARLGTVHFCRRHRWHLRDHRARHRCRSFRCSRRLCRDSRSVGKSVWKGSQNVTRVDGHAKFERSLPRSGAVDSTDPKLYELRVSQLRRRFAEHQIRIPQLHHQGRQISI